MIDLDELAAAEVRRAEDRRPPLSNVVARAARRRRRRRGVAVGVALGLTGLIGAAVVTGADSGDRQEVVSVDEVTTTAEPTSRIPEPIRVMPPSVSAPGGRWLDELFAELAAQLPTISEAELRAVVDRGAIDSRYRPAGTVGFEGLLLSGEYDIDEATTAAELLQAMSDRFTAAADELGYGAGPTPLDLAPYELVIVASIVEAEASTEADRPRIARVVYNRLEAELALGIDAICIYGSGDRDIELTAELLSDYGSFFAAGYDCRSGVGLPPTPIATPSRASLAAAIDPTPKPVADDGSEIAWLYYVPLDREGNQFFTDDLDEFVDQRRRAFDEGLLP